MQGDPHCPASCEIRALPYANELAAPHPTSYAKWISSLLSARSITTLRPTGRMLRCRLFDAADVDVVPLVGWAWSRGRQLLALLSSRVM